MHYYFHHFHFAPLLTGNLLISSVSRLRLTFNNEQMNVSERVLTNAVGIRSLLAYSSVIVIKCLSCIKNHSIGQYKSTAYNSVKGHLAVLIGKKQNNGINIRHATASHTNADPFASNVAFTHFLVVWRVKIPSPLRLYPSRKAVLPDPVLSALARDSINPVLGFRQYVPTAYAYSRNRKRRGQIASSSDDKFPDGVRMLVHMDALRFSCCLIDIIIVGSFSTKPGTAGQ